MRVTGTLASAAAAGTASALLLAGSPALAAQAGAARMVTGWEKVTGSLRTHGLPGRQMVVPLTLTGLVRAHGTADFSRRGLRLTSTAGTLALIPAGKPRERSHFNSRTCTSSVKAHLPVAVAARASTRRFAHATGRGTLLLTITITAGKPSHGQCSPNPKTLTETQSLTGKLLLTIRK